MATQQTVIKKFFGYSIDDKPTDSSIQIGSEFYEKDTGDTYKFDGVEWWFYSVNPQVLNGLQQKLVTSDFEVTELLESIIKELKITNLHLSMLTDEHFTKEEVE
jgi:hypothetical protein